MLYAYNFQPSATTTLAAEWSGEHALDLSEQKIFTHVSRERARKSIGVIAFRSRSGTEDAQMQGHTVLSETVKRFTEDARGHVLSTMVKMAVQKYNDGQKHPEHRIRGKIDVGVVRFNNGNKDNSKRNCEDRTVTLATVGNAKIYRQYAKDAPCTPNLPYVSEPLDIHLGLASLEHAQVEGLLIYTQPVSNRYTISTIDKLPPVSYGQTYTDQLLVGVEI